MEWIDQINLEEMKVTVAPFGGPIAVVRSDSKFTTVQTSGKPIIFIFSPSGHLKTSIKVRKSVILFLFLFQQSS